MLNNDQGLPAFGRDGTRGPAMAVCSSVESKWVRRVENMHYLTVQDMIWINLQVTKKTLPFNYAKLEEATFNQYGYGNSASVMNQAARLLSGFAGKKPFTNGNEAAAFIATMSFLKMNGFKVSLSDETATHWIERAAKDSSVATEALTDIASPDEAYHEDEEPSVRDVVHEMMDAYPKTLSLLSHSRALVGV